MAALSLAALGIVFGDIGTSPLYAFRAGFLKPEASQISNEVVFGLISVFFWTLILSLESNTHFLFSAQTIAAKAESLHFFRSYRMRRKVRFSNSPLHSSSWELQAQQCFTLTG